MVAAVDIDGELKSRRQSLLGRLGSIGWLRERFRRLRLRFLNPVEGNLGDRGRYERGVSRLDWYFRLFFYLARVLHLIHLFGGWRLLIAGLGHGDLLPDWRKHRSHERHEGENRQE